MKKNVCIMALLFIVSSFSVKLAAQENIEALLKKCETMPSVDMTVMSRQDPKTKKLERETVSLTICEDSKLVNEFIAVFEKDKDKATRVTENRKGGKIITLAYEFENVRYSISQTRNKEQCISIIITKRGTTTFTNSFGYLYSNPIDVMVVDSLRRELRVARKSSE
jgi:DNA integrity scanning protein DisA with diadenylate cyclase activity